MHNLKLQCYRELAGNVADVKFLLLDPNAGNNSTSKGDYLYAVTSCKVLKVSLVTDAGLVRELIDLPGIVGAEYLALDNMICLATGGGEVLCVDPETGTTTEGTFCDVGIECMAWSEDQEVVAFVTKERHVVVMTYTYDVLNEHELTQQCIADEQFVNVGWGKKETQFHGSEGKTAAKRQVGFRPPENVNELPQDISISWRADSAYFAVSFVSAEVGRMFKVFDKEGNLKFSSERVNDLQPPIAWRPTGTWIAVPQRLPNKSTVALFEKNGLRHREIVLPFAFAEEPVLRLRWNADSNILAVETQRLTTGLQSIYLYTIGNYHWYLKQVLHYEHDDPLVLWQWDQRIGEEKTLHVWRQSGKYQLYRWHCAVDRCARSGQVAVIDGTKLLLTDFAVSVVPPPMCSATIELETFINACTFNAKTEKLAVYDAENTLHIYFCVRHDYANIYLKKEKARWERDPEEPPAALLALTAPLPLSNLLWLNDTDLVATSGVANHSTLLLMLSLSESEDTYEYRSVRQLKGLACNACNGDSASEQLFVQTRDGTVHEMSHWTDALESQNYNVPIKKYAQLEQQATQLEWFQLRNPDTTGLVSLLRNKRLYVNTQLVASDVTSFCLAGNYLAYTKLCALEFVRLSDRRLVDSRKIERGGKLVTIVAEGARTVLQMPRGNLEVILPRVLSLEIVGKELEACRYGSALDMLRKQRINLNMLCDHNMNCFVINLEYFIVDIKNSNWLNLFLSELQNEDFTKTMYASHYAGRVRHYPDDFKIEQKVSYICKKMCALMEMSGEPHYRLPILTAYVKMGQLEKALQLTWQRKRHHSNAEPAPTTDNVAEEMLKYLLYLVDVNELYNVALGMYELPLVLFVAQKSQKDPKEYLPFLKELKQYDINYRKFKIDQLLKRYELALQHIAQCTTAERFEEAFAFIKQHELYQQALKCYAHKDVAEEPEGGSERQSYYNRICLAYADHLRNLSKFHNASIMYERGGDLKQALFSAKHVLDWQRVLILAQQSAQDVASVALSMVPALEEHGQHEVAYELLKTYGADFSEALRCLLKGKLYLKAILEARLSTAAANSSANLSEQLIKPELLAYCTLLQGNLSADTVQFQTHKERLLAVREARAKKLSCMESDDERRFLADEADLLSDTTSVRSSRYTGSSTGSGKTFRSSKNRRKHERKLLSLKPGNPFEDIALLDALHNLIVKLFAQQSHVHDTCKALLELQLDDVAAGLQQQFKCLLEQLHESLDAIWIPELMTAQEYLTGPNIDYTQLRNEQRYGLISPQKRYKPECQISDWEHEILR